MNRPASAASMAPEERARVSRVDQLLVEGDLDGLIAMLVDPSWAVRRAVVSAVAALGDQAARALCRLLVERRDDETRNAAIVDALVACVGPSTAALVGELAGHPDPHVAADVAQILGRRRATSELDTLITLTRHVDENVAVAAIEALGRVGGRAAIEALVETVRTGGFFRCFPAIDVLGRSGDPRAVDPLAELLSNPLLGAEAARALGRTGERRAVAPLAALLGGASAAMARVAAAALVDLEVRHTARVGDGLAITGAIRASAEPGRVRLLVQALSGADPAEQIAIARLLGIFGGADATAALARLLDSPPDVAQTAARALAQLADATERDLVSALFEGSSARRLALLPFISRAAAVPIVVKCLTDEDPGVRVAACDALARIGSGAPIPSLFELLSDPNPRVVQAATAAIQAIGGGETEVLADRACTSSSPTVRRAALRILAYFGWARALPRFLAALADPEPRVREAAVQGLPLIEDPAALDALLDIARGDSPRLRAVATRALGQCRAGVRVASALLRALSDEDPWVRYYAAQSLGRLNVDSATSAISRLLDDPAGQVRVAAIEALSHLENEVAFNALLDAAGSDDADVRRAALVGLGISRRPEAEPVLIAGVRSQDVATRLVAVSAIADFADTPGILDAFARAVADPEDSVRNAAISFLAARKGAAATRILIDALADTAQEDAVIAALCMPADARVPELARALDSADDELAPRLASALLRMRRAAADDALREALGSPNPAARKAVAAVIGAQATPDRIELLRRVSVEDPDPEVRRVAALALAQ